MKIAIDCRFYGKSGIGTYLKNIVDELMLAHSEHSYLLIVESCSNLIPLNENVRVLKTDIAPFSLREIFCFPVNKINECDVFLSPYINIPGRIKIPIYSTIHDVVFLDVPELVSPIGKIFRRWFIKRSYVVSEAVITVSEFSRKRIQHHFGSDTKVLVAYNCVSSSIISYVDMHAPQIKKGEYVIYVGNIKKHKGLRVLLEAFTMAIDNGYNKDLYIVGNADNFRSSDLEINTIIEKNPRVKFTGYLPDEELYEMISQADTLILPSLYEGFGLTPLESLYLGTDVILSDIEVLKEVYKGLPVTFFKVGDVYDLATKLQQNHAVIKDINELRSIINKRYNKKNIVNTILNQFA